MFVKRLIYSITAFLMLFFVVTVSAQENFEGYVKYNVTSEQDQQMDMTYYLKGSDIRIEMEHPTQKGAGAMLMKDGAMYVLMPQQKMYMKASEENMQSMSDEMEPNEQEIEDFKNSFTGETEDILGYETKKYVVDDEGQKTEMWLATDMGNFIAFQGPMGKKDKPEWAEKIGLSGFFPLRVKVYDSSGNLESSLEATEIEKTSVDGSKFEIPEGYTEFDMGNMMKGMQEKMKEKMK